MRHFLLIALLIQGALSSPKYHIKKIWLFSKTQYAGNVPKLPGGGQAAGHTDLLFCFIEISKDQPAPEWESAYFKGEKYSVTASPVNQDSLVVGIGKNSNTPLVIKPGHGGKLVQLSLTKIENENKQAGEGFALEGTCDKKRAYLKSVEPVVELAPDMMP